MTLASTVGVPGKMGEMGESAPKVERLNDEVFRLLVESVLSETSAIDATRRTDCWSSNKVRVVDA